MNQSYFAPISADHENISKPLTQIVSTTPSTALLCLLPPCLMLLAIDVALRARQRSTQSPIPGDSLSPDEMKCGGVTARKGLLGECDQKLAVEQRRSKDLQRMLRKQRNFTLHRHRLMLYKTQLIINPSPAPYRPVARHPSKGVCPSFSAFCDHLLLQNQIWKQQREIKSLRSSLDSVKAAGCSNAFQTFCESLLLSNKIWKLQKEVNRLTSETEQVKRSRVAAVTRAAKQMVLDVRKERLIEEYVKDLIAEVDECRDAVKSLRAEHEREIQEMAGGWREECRKYSLEIERLKLAQEARLLEQDLSNALEGEMMERLSSKQPKAEITYDHRLERNSSEVCAAYQSDEMETLSDFELEEMSNMSTTTYVGSAGGSPNYKSSFDESPGNKKGFTQRRAPLSSLKIPPRESSSTYFLISPTTKKSPVRRLDPGPYAGFSFNPLFFGHAEEPRQDLKEKENQGKRVFSLKLPPKPQRSSTRTPLSTSQVSMNVVQAPKRVQWKV
ncbi:hypothetical protein B0H34DRAFT_728961 [Crassisporium funariophilum]|nr:hypothetical protein B0H34DRAFT_728961 [Crassisporium funariophilum]